MATLNGFFPAKTIGGNTGAAPVLRGYTTAAEDLSEGDVVYWASGYLTRFSAATDGAIAGVMAEDVVGETGVNKSALFYPATPSTIFKAYSDDTVADTMVGANHDITGASGAMGIDQSSTTNGGFKIIEVDSDSDACYGVFDGDQSQFIGG